MIDRFWGDNFFLSNFAPAVTKYGRLYFAHAENAYQASKTLDEKRRLNFMYLIPSDAKTLGRNLKLREDWEEVKDQIMFEIVMDKFSRNPILKKKLLETGDKQLIKGNTWHDNHFGNCICKHCKDIIGKNQLGIILMDIRERLRG